MGAVEPVEIQLWQLKGVAILGTAGAIVAQLYRRQKLYFTDCWKLYEFSCQDCCGSASGATCNQP